MQNGTPNTLQYSFTNQRTPSEYDPTRSQYNRSSMSSQPITSFTNVQPLNLNAVQPSKQSVYVTPATATPSQYNQTPSTFTTNPQRIISTNPTAYASPVSTNDGMPTTYKNRLLALRKIVTYRITRLLQHRRHTINQESTILLLSMLVLKE